MISGSGNIVVSGTGGTSGFSGFSNKSITASFPGLSAPPSITIPNSLSSMNIPTTTNSGALSIPNTNTQNSGQNLLNNMQSNSIGFTLPNPPNISLPVNSNQQPASQQYAQPSSVNNQNSGYSSSYNQLPMPNLQSNYPPFPNQQAGQSFPFTQPQIQVPSFSFPTSNQGFQMLSPQSNPGTSYMMPPVYSYPFIGTGSNFGSIQQVNPYNAYNPYQSSTNQNYSPYVNNAAITYPPYNYYSSPTNNPYVTNNPALSNIYQQFPNTYQQAQSSYSASNPQNYQNYINSGNTQFNPNMNNPYASNVNMQPSSSSVPSTSAPPSGYYNSQFSQSNNLGGSSQNSISGLQVLQNLMLKLNSNGMGINQ
jgi:hypothetical protein